MGPSWYVARRYFRHPARHLVRESGEVPLMPYIWLMVIGLIIGLTLLFVIT